MANEFTSAAFHIGEPTDSRILSLRAGFCALTQQQVNELVRRMKRFMDESLPELCLSWNNDGKKRREKDVKREIECGVCGINGAFLSFNGFIRSELVYNASSLKKAKNALLCPTLPQRYDNCAADYPEYFEKHISGVLNDPERLKTAMSGLFSVPAHESVKPTHGADLSGGITTRRAADGSFFGNMDLAMSLVCVESMVETIADELLLFAERLSAEFVDLNAHVGLETQCIAAQSVYMRYFGCGGRLPDYSNGFFLCALSWVNIVSRRTLDAFALTLSSDADIVASELPGGAYMLKSKKALMETNIPELCRMKRMLYPALYPGRCFFQYRAMQGGAWTQISRPRCDWEPIPVLDEEIIILEDGIELRHSAYGNFPEGI